MYRPELYSPALLWILWAIHIFLLILQLVVVAFFVLELKGRKEEHVPAAYPIGLALIFANFFAEPIEIALWIESILEPWVYLTLQVLKALLWSAWTPLFLIDSMRIYISPGGLFGKYLPIVVRVLSWLSIPTAVSFHASLICAIVIFIHQRRTRGYEKALEEDKEIERPKRSSKVLKSRYA